MTVKTALHGHYVRIPLPWEARSPAHHFEVVEYVEVDGRDPVPIGSEKAITPAAAQALGFSLPDILGGLNFELLVENDELRTQLAAATLRAEQAEARASAAEAIVQTSFVEAPVPQEDSK